MQLSELISFINGKQEVRSTDFPQIKDLISKYPFFETVYNLYLVALKKNNNSNFETELNKYAIFINDRKNIYQKLFEVYSAPSPEKTKKLENELIKEPQNKEIDKEITDKKEKVSETKPDKKEKASKKDKEDVEFDPELFERQKAHHQKIIQNIIIPKAENFAELSKLLKENNIDVKKFFALDEPVKETPKIEQTAEKIITTDNVNTEVIDKKEEKTIEQTKEDKSKVTLEINIEEKIIEEKIETAPEIITEEKLSVIENGTTPELKIEKIQTEIIEPEKESFDIADDVLSKINRLKNEKLTSQETENVIGKKITEKKSKKAADLVKEKNNLENKTADLVEEKTNEKIKSDEENKTLNLTEEKNTEEIKTEEIIAEKDDFENKNVELTEEKIIEEVKTEEISEQKTDLENKNVELTEEKIIEEVKTEEISEQKTSKKTAADLIIEKLKNRKNVKKEETEIETIENKNIEEKTVETEKEMNNEEMKTAADKILEKLKKSETKKEEPIVFELDKVEPENITETKIEQPVTEQKEEIKSDIEVFEIIDEIKIEENKEVTVVEEQVKEKETQEDKPKTAADKILEKISKRTNKNKPTDLIDKFLIEQPTLDRKKTPETEKDLSEKSIKEPEIVTERLAEIYALQGLYEKAIETYKKLILKYPEKSSLFAEKIKEIQNKK